MKARKPVVQIYPEESAPPPKEYFYVCIRDGVGYGDGQKARCGTGGVEDSTMIRTPAPISEWMTRGKPRRPGSGIPRGPAGWREATEEEVRVLGHTAEPVY